MAVLADRRLVGRLRSRSCIIDGEAVACDDKGVSSFDRIRHREYDDCVFLYAFDLIELNGDDPAPAAMIALAATRRRSGMTVSYFLHLAFRFGGGFFVGVLLQ